MHALLRKQGAMPNQPLRGARPARVTVVRARNGYRAAFSLAELDPRPGAREALLADRCNGAAPGSQDGPWRLIAPAKSRPARWVRLADSTQVVDAP